MLLPSLIFFLFFFNAPAPPEIYTLSLHDALPILVTAIPRARAAARSTWSVPAPKLAISLSASPACPIRADRKSTRLNSSHSQISYAVFCLKKKKKQKEKQIECMKGNNRETLTIDH